MVKDFDTELKRVRVWYDPKRECFVSNAGFVWGKIWGVTPQTASSILAAYIKSLDLDWIEDVWVS